MIRNTCKCGKDAGYWGFTCADCKWKQERNGLIFAGIGLVLFFVLMIGIRFAWAKYAYNDWRCTFSECRIIK